MGQISHQIQVRAYSLFVLSSASLHNVYIEDSCMKACVDPCGVEFGEIQSR